MAETIEFIDPDGSVTSLHTTANIFAEWNLAGRFAPPARFEREGVPEHDGDVLRAVFHDPREVSLPLWVQGSSESDLRTRLRSLVSTFNPKRGDGRLRITSPVGDQRELVCRVVAGAEGAEQIGSTANLTALLLPLVFRASDPYWYATSDVVVPYTIGGTASWFPIFPLQLGSSELFTNASVTNDGDLDAWPVWTITGPGSAINLRNLTTGKLLTLSTTLSTDSVTIDTRFGVKTVTRSDGANLFGSLSDLSSLWPLQRGSNSIRIEMSSATAASSVRLAFRPRYLTA